MLQPDGKVVIAGRISPAPGYRTDFALARFNADGTLDPSFGGDGAVTTNFGSYEEAHAVALQPDGKIVAVGGPSLGGTAGFLVARYLPNGALDPSFSQDGRVRIANGLSRAFDVVLQPDGKLVAAGWATAANFAALRLKPNGARDLTFSGDGVAVVDAGASEFAFAVGRQADGKIVIGGHRSRSGVPGAGMVARLTAAGRPDTMFGSRGKVITPFNSTFRAIQDLIVQPDGKIAVAGETSPENGTLQSDEDFIVARYTTSGVLDTGFSQNGIAVSDFAPFGSTDYARGLALQPDGKLIAVGAVNSQVALVRYLPSGAPDPAFGPGGRATTSAFGDGEDGTLQPDGKLVVACCNAAARFQLD